MKSLTKTQRRKIYLKVANNIQNNIENTNPLYLCNELYKEINKLADVEMFIDLFCEFYLFEPKPILYYKDAHYVPNNWFPSENNNNHKKSNIQRINCMLLCAEMCK